MSYKFYGWESANMEPVNRLYNIKTPRELYDILSGIWCRETCAPRLQKEWTEDNMTLGQCSITAFLVQDIFGGKVYGVKRPGGNYHCYNVVGDCTFDLTSEQFGDEELQYDNNPEQFREIHFVKEEKRLRYESLKHKLDEYMKTYRRGYTCPVCGKHKFSRNGDYEICPECGWENDPIQNNDEDYDGGANKMSLREAKINFQRLLTSALMLIAMVFMLCSCGGSQVSKSSGEPILAADGASSEDGEAALAVDNSSSEDSEAALAVDKDFIEASDAAQVSDSSLSDSDTTVNDDSTADPTEESPAKNEGFLGEKYKFRNQKLLDSHFQKHGIEMGFANPEDYQRAASSVAENPDSLHKIEKEDGDDVFYLEDTNEFVIVSTDGYIRTYFLPDRGKSYFDRQ